MINQIVVGIAEALNTEFGDRYEIWAEDIEQGLQEPCFFITTLSSEQTQFLGRRYFKSNSFSIQYFPENPENYDECRKVLEKLFHCLELINFDGGLLQGTKMKAEVHEGILTFMIEYSFFAYKTEDITKMETHKVNTEMEG